MLFDLPDHTTLYAALLARDTSYDGRAFVGVTSTGIFCRLTCPARKPKPENSQFYQTVAECFAAGFRPCKRCHPLGPAADTDPAIQTLLKALTADSAHKWAEADIIRLGFDPSTVRRSFKRQFGVTFLEMARVERLRNGFTTLSNGGRVIDAQMDAGFSSPNAFRLAFANLLGTSPADFTKDALLRADWIDTPLGAMVAVSDRSALHLLEFSDRKALPAELKKLRKAVKGNIGIGRFDPTNQIETELAAFFAAKSAKFDTKLALHGSPFARDVWQALKQIPAGETRSYSDIARGIGNPAAVRAVARANGANQIAIAIPCHRVIGADGSLTGYGGGLWRKEKLIALERQFLIKS
ncbi:MAG: bifunctional transcriptional activator/DNA repair protein Ada [Rhodobacteraceae bacterium]|nr:bifunctional transcriptional activator/DNA repair protein Ada [Paracoccaceae bacterium]